MEKSEILKELVDRGVISNAELFESVSNEKLNDLLEKSKEAELNYAEVLKNEKAISKDEGIVEGIAQAESSFEETLNNAKAQAKEEGIAEAKSSDDDLVAKAVKKLVADKKVDEAVKTALDAATVKARQAEQTVRKLKENLRGQVQIMAKMID